MDHRYGKVKWGPGNERKRTKTWGDPRKWERQAEQFFAEHGRRRRVFCASLADVFDNEVPDEWRIDLFALIRDTPSLDWLLLTKRIGNVAKMLPADWGNGYSNVWLGIPVVNQEESDRDIPKLLKIYARIRWLSMEPILGEVDITRWLYGPDTPCKECPLDSDCECGWEFRRDIPDNIAPGSIDFCVVGGESGSNHREFNPDWARSLRDQCKAAGVAFFFKQMSGTSQRSMPPIPDDLMVKEFPK
jgi:protein gp37